jgi:hypothetical protein
MFRSMAPGCRPKTPVGCHHLSLRASAGTNIPPRLGVVFLLFYYARLVLSRRQVNIILFSSLHVFTVF